MFYSQFYGCACVLRMAVNSAVPKGLSPGTGAKQGRLHPLQTLPMSWDSVHKCFVGIKVTDGGGGDAWRHLQRIFHNGLALIV